MAGASVAITGARLVPITGDPIESGTLLVQDGKIAAIGPDVAVPDGTQVVDVSGSWVLPGFIEAHGHVGVHEEAEGWAGSDTNELTDPVTAQVRALDAINPADLGFRDAIGGGVLAVNVNPGSGNPIGGQTVAIKCWGRTEPAGAVYVSRDPVAIDSLVLPQLERWRKYNHVDPIGSHASHVHDAANYHLGTDDRSRIQLVRLP